MFAVIFAVQPKKERWDDYLELARFLKPELEKIYGFIDNERFSSRRTPGRVLSLSTWRDEKSVLRWRTLGVHHQVQEKGRLEIFHDYHLRVGEILADTHVPPGASLAQQRFDETETGAAKALTITELSPRHGDKPVSPEPEVALGVPWPGADEVIDHEVFDSIYNPGKQLVLVSWKDRESAERWQPVPVSGGEIRHRLVRVVRDYGMRDRREAPQYYPDV